MKVFEEGEAIKGICKTCRKVVPATFRLVDFKVKPNIIVPNMLVSVCNHCESIIGIPPQSSLQISEALTKK